MQKIGQSSFFLSMICLLAFLFCGQKVDEGDRDPAQTFLTEGKSLWDSGKFDSAYVLFRKAQAAALQGANRPTQLEAIYRSGLYLSRQQQLTAAAQTLDSAIALGTQIDSLSATTLFARRERAYVALNQGYIPDAIDRYHQILEDVAPLPQAADSIRALLRESLGQAYFYQGNFEAGLASSLEALTLYRGVFSPDHVKIGICANTLGIMYMYLDRFEESARYFEQAVDIFNRHYPPVHPNVLQIQTNLGVLYGELGLFWKALRVHQQVYEQKASLEPRPYLNALLNLGATSTAVGDYHSALTYFEQAETFAQKHPDLASEQAAYIAQNRSTILQQLGKREAALIQIEKSLQINRENKGEDHPELITDYLQLGQLLMSEQQFRKAATAFEKAFFIAKKQIGAHSLQGGHALGYLGILARRESQFSLSEKHFQGALKQYAGIGDSLFMADAYKELAINYRTQGDSSSCMDMHMAAWNMLFPELPFQMMPDKHLAAFWHLHPLEEMIFEQGKSIQHFQQTKAPLQAALACHEVVIAAVDSQKHFYGSAASRQVRLQDQLAVYEAAIRCCHDLYAFDMEETYLQRAFQLAEKSKANDLRDHLRGVGALRFAGLPDSVLARERDFRQRIAAGGESAAEMRHRYRTFIRELEAKYPKYYALKYAPQAPRTAAISQRLSAGEALYSYFWGKENLFVFQHTQGKIDCYRQEIDSVEKRLNEWTDFISHPPQEASFPIATYAKAGFRLREILLPRFSGEIQKLVILPHGPLGYLSFESLLQEKPRGSDFRAWPFVGKSCAISYSPAAEVWLQQQPQPNKKGRYVGFAPQFDEGTYVGTRAGLTPLIHNQEEVQAVATLLHGKAMTGRAANEASIKMLDGENHILHFATHALADEEQLMQSRLFLQQSEDSTEDGILYAFEIYGLELNSSLCVLSACQTAKGPLQRGEGIMSLARAFQYSGCQRVLSTLWQTDDRAGAEISRHFFEKMVEGKAIERALQESRRQWLREADNQYAHPYYWANYVLIGKGGHILIEETQTPWMGIAGLLVLALGLGLFVFFRKRKGLIS